MRNTSNDSRFIQQHLANERTYLAWVRTCIAIIGLGFLATGLLFRSNIEHWISMTAGVGAVFLGIGILAMATRDFFWKRKAINEERFRSPAFMIGFAFFSLGCIGALLAVLILILAV
ncbi:YidH family protein [Paenibacillus humicola]|uniref:YidH family protein n=1 Tax=Paenibacillus humicola TaxID=3110540 RepID=UPI00237BBF5F|nr:DUF202 domain-containing protein [Paenibacillus humicola]